MLEELKEKIKTGKFVIMIIGLGRVGLPLAVMFANKGIKTIGFDTNTKLIDYLEEKKSPFFDPPLQKKINEKSTQDNLNVKNQIDSITDNVDVIFITVGTPTLDNKIDYSQIYSALSEIIKIGINKKLIILRSTMPPNTTLNIIIPYLEYNSQLVCGKDFGIAVCPERIVEGQAIKELEELPEIIGGINQECNEMATNVFQVINPSKEFRYTTTTGAELGKLFANIYRYTNFALSNEFAIWAERYNLDANELIKIVNYKYPRSKIPIPGFVGGPCLSKDGTFLDNDTTFISMISAIWKLNESIPQHIVNNIRKLGGNLFNKKIAVLGIAFKKDSDDVRNSPSMKMVEILESQGAQVLVHDPHIKNTMKLSEVLESAEIVVLATNHSEFDDIHNQINTSDCKIIYDVWSMFDEKDFPHKQYEKFGRGFKGIQ